MIDYVKDKPIKDSAPLYESTYRAIMSSKLNDKKKLEALTKFLDFGFYNEEIPDDDTNPILSVIYMSNKRLFVTTKEKYNKSKEDGNKGGAQEQIRIEDVVMLKNQGLSNKDIAEKLGCSVRTVERKLEESRKPSSHKAEAIPTRHNPTEPDRTTRHNPTEPTITITDTITPTITPTDTITDTENKNNTISEDGNKSEHVEEAGKDYKQEYKSLDEFEANLGELREHFDERRLNEFRKCLIDGDYWGASDALGWIYTDYSYIYGEEFIKEKLGCYIPTSSVEDDDLPF